MYYQKKLDAVAEFKAKHATIDDIVALYRDHVYNEDDVEGIDEDYREAKKGTTRPARYDLAIRLAEYILDNDREGLDYGSWCKDIGENPYIINPRTLGHVYAQAVAYLHLEGYEMEEYTFSW